ncbi:macrophage mannose receptor 1-like [Micropterus dolomieu]|uniref:macrophage mannose receptor 1-like n=1 Tax=Micropterus dolomieu TaxID=147949 RepID=UPI001E8E28AF|nr:macrophage mannose receptor 1-like [Micropterus dolomieu]
MTTEKRLLLRTSQRSRKCVHPHIRNLAENDAITKLAAGDSVWIGLYWQQLWSDGSPSLFQNWANGQPDSPEQCVTTMFRNSGLWSDDNCSLTLPFICYSTIPPKTEDFRSIGQNESSITLQWNKVNNNFSFILQFNGAEININAPDGDGPRAIICFSEHQCKTKTYLLAPPNAEIFRPTRQVVTSITLQWNKSLTPETRYTFTLFSVFENVRSSGVSITAVTGNRQYYFESTPLNWTAAQSFCRRIYTDLATIETYTGVNSVLYYSSSSYRGKAWIGLYGGGWRWSLSNSSFYGEGETGFRNWAPGYPYNSYGRQNCVMLQSYYYYYYYFNNYNGKWLDVDCNYQFFSVCYNGSVNGKSSFVKVNTPLNWIQAQRYCRENYVDLASVRNRAENFALAKLAAGDSVWIGLYWEQLWSDGSPSVFQYWASGQPDSAEQCVTTAFRNSGRWSDDNCSLSLPFICYSTSNASYFYSHTV